MEKYWFLLLAALLGGATCIFAKDTLATWKAPAGVALNSDFTVKVRLQDGVWHTLSSYLIKVDEVRDTRHYVENASMAIFDFTGKVEVAVTYNLGEVQTAKVRPLSYDIPFQIDGNTVTFTLEHPRNLSVEVNGDIFHNLHLFTGSPERTIPDKDNPEVIYFGPGIHTVKNGELRVPSGKTVYLAGGAVLMGRVLIENVHDVKLLGRGIIDHSIKGGIRIANSRDVYVEGIVATQCATGGSENVTIRNVKSISYYGWGDGMNVFASNNVLFDGVFCRNSDDCTTVYGTRLGFEGGCRNITMQNSTLWADVAHPIFIGIHGNSKAPEVLEDLNYINIDILDHREKQVDYQGCMAINAGDNNLIRNVHFEDIRVENFRQGQLVNLRIFYNEKYCTAPGRGIENVLFKNISYTGENAELSIIEGYDEKRKVKNIRFENLKINGKLIDDNMPDKPRWYKTSDMARIYVGPHVENIVFTSDVAQSQRRFVHPGITYTQGDLDRMKAMVEARQEPYYSTFLKLKESSYSSLDAPVVNRGEQIKEGRFNATIGVDGRRAHDLALLWHLTGEEAYARKAVEYLNANSYYTNTSSRGTGPLDNGKIYLLIDAAEMMRDYSGWTRQDQQRFKDMLVYPGYSNTENYSAKYANYLDDTKNGVTFYWNIYNFDAARFGNQGLFAARSMMAMAIYLDNEIMYDRAYRYLLGMKHRKDDLPYPSGPAISSDQPIHVSPTMIGYKLLQRKNDIQDYGYDEQLQYYIYPNGQCQESSRDQGHVLAGLHNYVAIAEMAWNQGDSLYSSLDNRLLLGLEWSYRYNLSSIQSYKKQETPWEPTGLTKDMNEVTFDNGKYLQIKSRSGRWESVNISSHGRGDVAGTGGTREMALAHYAVRSGLPAEKYTWLQRYRDYMIERYGCENWGVAPNWFYEWTGWGTLTKRLTPWMAGDPVTFSTGKRVSGLHQLPSTILAADYDYYCISENPEGHTYHNIGTVRGNEYRPDGAVELQKIDNKYVVVQVEDGEWMNYTVNIPKSGAYAVYLTYSANSSSHVAMASDQGLEISSSIPSSKKWKETKLGELSLSAGACVLRLRVDKAGQKLCLSAFRLEKVERDR